MKLNNVKPGDLVDCVDPIAPLRYGARYRVERVRADFLRDLAMLVLRETDTGMAVERTTQAQGFFPWRFRPVA